MRNKRNWKKWDIILFFVLWCLYNGAMLWLFHRQTVHYGGGYESDMGAYVLHIQGMDTGYQYPYPVMFWAAGLLQHLVSPELAVALAVTALNSLTPLCLKAVVSGWLGKEAKAYGNGDTAEQGSLKDAIVTNMLLFSLLFVSMLYIGRSGQGMRYKGVFSPNPFHNATYLAARGFAVAAFFLFLELLEQKQAADRRKYIAFGAALLLATMTKPSFTLGFVACAGLVLLYQWIKDGWKAWKWYVAMGLCFVPTFLDLLYQYKDVFTGTNGLGEETGIGIGWLTAWHTAASSVPLALVLGLAFPAVVLAFNWKECGRNRMYGISWLMFGINLAMMMCLYEKGFRLGHMNFAWGYMYGMFFVYTASVLVLLQRTKEGVRHKWTLAVQWGVYLLHLLCGILYFAGIMRGESFV